ncbi:unnamed protein product, partial [Pleuronectes platessa]
QRESPAFNPNLRYAWGEHSWQAEKRPSSGFTLSQTRQSVTHTKHPSTFDACNHACHDVSGRNLMSIENAFRPEDVKAESGLSCLQHSLLRLYGEADVLKLTGVDLLKKTKDKAALVCPENANLRDTGPGPQRHSDFIAFKFPLTATPLPLGRVSPTVQLKDTHCPCGSLPSSIRGCTALNAMLSLDSCRSHLICAEVRVRMRLRGTDGYGTRVKKRRRQTEDDERA